MTILIIARHGNTFDPDQAPTRVGGRTDLPLVEKGREQAQKLGAWLKEHNFIPEITYCSNLQRTKETAEIAIKELNYSQPAFPLEIFNEVDYGPDENQTEDKVIERIGADAIKKWDEEAIVPDGWNFNSDECIQNWKNFADHILKDDQDTILVVTSNGIARFAPHLTGNFEDFKKNHSLKLSTGALGLLKFEDNQWHIVDWNVKP